MDDEDDEKNIIGLDLTSIDLFIETFQIELKENIVGCDILAYWWEKNQICSQDYKEGKIIGYNVHKKTEFPSYSHYKIRFSGKTVQWIPEYFIVYIGNYIT